MITKKFQKALAAHPLCQPDLKRRKFVTVQRLDARGTWKRDDGYSAAAWIGARANGDAVVWIAECACTDYGLCPLAHALEHAVELDCPSTSVERVPTVRTSLKRTVTPTKKPTKKSVKRS